MYEDEESIIRLDDKERVNLFLQVLANPLLYKSFTDKELFIMKRMVTRFTKGQINQIKIFYDATSEGVIKDEVNELRAKQKTI